MGNNREDNVYELTINIADKGTILLTDGGNSSVGHMWYAISGGDKDGSYGFAPVEHGDANGPGEIKTNDSENYTTRYYSAKIIINEVQYRTLTDFGMDKNLDGKQFDFNTEYKGLSNSCIDYTWKALHEVGINPKDLEGKMWPTHNADNVDEILYKYAHGETKGWDESLPDAGGYNVMYGSKEDDTLIDKEKNSTIYAGAGNDHLEGGKGMDVLYGGKEDDTLIGGYDGSKDDNAVDVLYGGEGFDTYYVNNKDIIQDSDGLGRIVFNGVSLTGEKQKLDEHNYIDEHFKYSMEDTSKIGRLTVTNLKTNESIAIEQFDPSSSQLGIVLEKENIIDPIIKSHTETYKDAIQTPYIQQHVDKENHVEVDLHHVTPITLGYLMADIPKETLDKAEVTLKTEDEINTKGQQCVQIEKGDTFQDVVEHTKLSTPVLLERNIWLLDNNRVSFPKDSIVTTHKDNLSITDTMHHEANPDERLEEAKEDTHGMSKTHTSETGVVISQGIISVPWTDLEMQNGKEIEPYDVHAKAQEIALSVYDPANDNVDGVGLERE